MKPYVHASLGELYAQLEHRRAQRQRWARAVCFVLPSALALVVHLLW